MNFFELLAQIEDFPTSPPLLCEGDFWGCFNFLFMMILKTGAAAAFVLSVIMFAWAGFLYMAKPEKSQEIHKRLLWGAVGFIVAILSYALIKALQLLITPPPSTGSGFFISPSLSLINFVLAQEEPPKTLKCGGINIPSVLETTTLNIGENAWFLCLVYIIQVILNVFYKAVFVLATIFLLWTGIQYITKPEKSADLHKNFIYITIGIIMGFFSFTIVKLIDLFFRTGF